MQNESAEKLALFNKCHDSRVRYLIERSDEIKAGNVRYLAEKRAQEEADKKKWAALMSRMSAQHSHPGGDAA
ncbi:MAG: hypothetical protein ACR652_23060 [Methylocystis sp.]|uniref:hypothetical protein n=1 Tax=Methylocystis sp. TaxID=1911079 RepID=UPI003DA2ADE7